MEIEQIQTEKATWLERYRALDSVINIIKTRINFQGLARSQTMALLLDQLKAFGKGQFDFFFYDMSFQPNNNEYRHSLASLNTISEESELAPYKLNYSVYDYVLRVTLNQIATDIAEIQRRQEEQTKADNNQDDRIAKTLQLADWLALQAIKTFSANITTPFTALTIIQKSSYVRVFPYAPVALVGIPYSAISVDLDFLTIPHEVAHFLYWHGKDSAGLYLRNKLKDLVSTSPIAIWSEEIFADVVGTLIGGPIMAQSVQQMMKEVVAKPFDSDDGIHPIPRIRPYVHLAVLEQIAGKENLHYAKLFNSWFTVEDARPLQVDSFSLLEQSKTPQLRMLRQSIPEVVGKFTKVQLMDEIKTIVGEVLGLFPNWQKLGNTSWTKLSDTSPLVEQLNAYFNALRVDLPIDIDQTNDIDQTKFNIINEANNWKENYTWEFLVKTNYGVETDNFKSHLQTILPEKWIEILNFDGWTTEGPGPGHVTPG